MTSSLRLMSLPFQAMFHPPGSLNDNVQQFLMLAEAQKVLADLNQILHKTAFNPRISNPCFLLAVLSTFLFSGAFTAPFLTHISDMTNDFDDGGSSIGLNIGGLLLTMFLPFLCFFVLVYYFKASRKRQLLNHVADLNR